MAWVDGKFGRKAAEITPLPFAWGRGRKGLNVFSGGFKRGALVSVPPPHSSTRRRVRGVLFRPRGLEQFVPSNTMRVKIWPLTDDGKLIDVLIGPVSSRPSCHSHADQCTIGSMTTFFCSSRLRCTGNPDCFHRLWNDVQDGWKLGWQWGVQFSKPRASIGQSSSARTTPPGPGLSIRPQ